MMNSVTIIEKKRDGHALSREEIRFFIEGYVKGSIPDYQAAAWCMAVFLNGMTGQETTDLTLAMAESGETLDFSGVLDIALDKHSSGGVGDKTSLVVLPLVVACGVPVAKMSGRGLSFTGGTLDKLESIDGYNVNLSREQFLEQARRIGIVLSGTSADLAPADGKLYALRDVTGTVPSKPLIASSIMSKKIAAGADAILLDVKCGSGAFMHSVDDARELAEIMVDIGTRVGRKVTALISDMNQPLGHAVGNSIEVREAIDALHGGGPEDFVEHCLVVAGNMLRLAGKSTQADLSDIRPTLEESLQDGAAWRVFRQLVEAQGGDVSQIDSPELLPIAPVAVEVESPRQGYLAAIHAGEVGLTAQDLGAGRRKKGDPVDHAVGVIVHYKVGDRVEKGEVLFTIYARSQEAANQAAARLSAALSWSDEPVERLPLFYDTLSNLAG
jgi:pyrimidine-nucleoside phosphorylase